MPFNTTDEELTDEVKMEVFRHSIYAIQGFSIVLFNGIIIATIVRYQALRFMKEYTILGALALADALAGLGTLTAGIYRIPVWLSQQDMVPASGRFCLLTPHNFLWSWFFPAQHGMLTIVSIDRVISVAKPLKYLTFTRRYAFAMTAVPYSLALVGSVAIYMSNWSNVEPIYTKVCWSSHAYGMTASKILIDGVASATSLSSIVIYMAIPILYKKHSAQVSGGNSQAKSNLADEMKFQKQLNKAVAVSCTFTFVFVFCPYMIRYWFLNIAKTQEEYEQIAPWMLIVSNVNSIVNLFVYIRKKRHFKVAFKALFKNKTLAPNLQNWPKN